MPEPTTPTTPNVEPTTPNVEPQGNDGRVAMFQTPPETPQNFLETLPEDFRDKDYLKGVDSLEGVLQKLDGAQQLIGKKTLGMPEEGATPEQWNEFYDKLGRPESPDKYEFDDSMLGEGETRDEGLTQKVKEIFHEVGIPANQAKALQSKYDTAMRELVTQQKAQADQEFDTLMDSTFGDKRDEATKNAREMVEKHIPTELQAHVQGLDNKALLVMAAAFDNIKKTYVTGDSFNTTSSDVTAGSSESLQNQAQELMAGKAYNDPMHPQHEATRKRAAELYQQVARARGLR